MNIEVLEKSDKKLIFIIEDISVEMVNAVRRIILTEIPVMAIDEVIILKNDSPLYDEIVSHRLGMIPLTTDLEKYNLPRDCECGGYGCPLCQVSLTLEVVNTDNRPMLITSADLNSNDPDIAPVSPNIPILKIDKDDKAVLEAYAVLGLAKDHVKWQAVSNVAYRYYPEIEIDEKKLGDEDIEHIIKMCSKKLFEKSNGGIKIKDDYWKTCSLCNSCQENAPEGAIKVGWKDRTYIFSIESDGVLDFNTLLTKTFEIFLGKIDEFTKDLETIEIEE